MVKQLSQNSLFIFAVSFLALFSVGSLSSYAEEVNNEEQENEAIIDNSNSRNTSNLLEIISRVPEALVQDFFNGSEPVGVPLGTDYPIQFGDLPNGGQLAGASDYIAVSYISNAGQPQPITPNDIANLAEESANRGGIFSHQNSDDEGTLTQRRRIPVIDLVVYNKRNRQYSLVPNVNINAFSRDAFNGALTHTLVSLNDSSITNEENQLDD